MALFQLLWAGEASLSPFCAPKCPFRTFRCFAWLIHDFAPSPMRALVFRSAYSASRNARASAAFAASIKAHRAVSSKTLMLQVRCAHPPMPHRTSSSSCSGVPVGLFSEKALQLFLQNARPSAAARPPVGGGSFALPLLRTEPALRAAPVFRSAYFSKKLFSFFSKTLDLQPLCGLRWAGEASLPPAPLSPAPAVLIFPLCKRRRICFQADRQDAAAPERSSFRCQDSIPVISRQPALRRLTFPAARPAPQSGRPRRRCRSKA